MNSLRWLLPVTLFAFACVQCSPIGPPPGVVDHYARSTPAPGPASGGGGSQSADSLLRQVNVKQAMVRKGVFGRRGARPMRPRYITIHSTQNYTAGAERHAVALQHGALRTGQRPGYLIWHFTVED